jgi:Rad52/22 family double-strand break repair protein
MTQHKDIFAALAAPFASEEVKIRSQAGKQLHYITARTVMNRLDEVVGPENWWDDYVPLEHSVLCKLSVRLPDGQVLTKADAGGYAGMADPGDDDKSGYADAFKRAAVKFGIGRYLYRDGVPRFALAAMRATAMEEPPKAEGTRVAVQLCDPPKPQTGNTQEQGAPRSGRALFAWVKDQDEKHEYGLLKHINQWAKRQDFPGRMVDFEGEQVARAYSECCRKIRAIQNMRHATEAVLGNGRNEPVSQEDVDRWEREGSR